MEIFVIALVLGAIPAIIAKNKGRSFFGWYIYGVSLFLIALIHSLVMKEDKKVVEENELADGTIKNVDFVLS